MVEPVDARLKWRLETIIVKHGGRAYIFVQKYLMKKEDYYTLLQSSKQFFSILIYLWLLLQKATSFSIKHFIE